jgi:BCD family chlorophyll transporter-like MFS transporter
MMMLGILAGVFLGVGALEAYAPPTLISLFLAVALAVVLLTVIAIWRQEKPGTSATRAAVSTREALSLLNGRQPRLFFAFLASGILFLFLQQVVLEPFGGDVFGMSIRQTTLFNAYQMVGVLAAMAVGGMWLSRRLGEKRTAGLGLVVASLSFALLGAASILQRPGLVPPAIALMGAGMGFFNVGGLALMMGMSVEGNNGVFMGLWTLAQALANGLASVGGGFTHDWALRILASEPAAYATVFLLEAGGLIATTFLLAGVNTGEFRAQARARVAPA